ncbi:MAG: hypothetical protein KDC03_13705, partial [Flavobacteriales bacterium]|nr:hypothetical protein [Flavobacteriales bacterium]
GQTPHLITVGEEVLQREESQPGGRSKLAFIMVEAFQNILRHRDRDADGTRSLFLMRSPAGRRSVAAVNHMVPGEEDALEELLQRIRAADAPALKRMFLDRLSDSGRNSRGGAGLGLIEMARRSGHDLRHRIVHRQGGTALFLLEVVLGEVEGEGEDDAMNDLRSLYEGVEDQGVVLQFRHPGPPAILEALMKVLAGDLEDEGRGDTRRQALLAATDLLKELSVQGSAALGDLRLLRANDELYLELDHVLGPAEAEKLAAEVAELNALDTLAMRQRYRQAMLGEAKGGAPGRFALLDLARHAREPLVLRIGVAVGERMHMRLRATV